MVLVWYWYVRLVLLVKKRIHSQIQQAIQLTTILKYSKQSILKYDIKKRGGGELLLFRIQADETVHLCGFFLGFGIGVKYCTRGHAEHIILVPGKTTENGIPHEPHLSSAAVRSWKKVKRAFSLEKYTYQKITKKYTSLGYFGPPSAPNPYNYQNVHYGAGV